MSGTSSTTETRPVSYCHALEELELRLPFWRYAPLYVQQPHAFLLDSARDPEKLGRYSFLGGEPFLVYKAWRQRGQPPSSGARIEVTQYRTADGQPLSQPVIKRRPQRRT